jgi:hypothetical protein
MMDKPTSQQNGELMSTQTKESIGVCEIWHFSDIYNLVQYILDCLYQNGVFNKQNFQLVADIFSGTHN